VKLVRLLAAAGLLLAPSVPAHAQGELENPTGSRVGRARPADMPEMAGLSRIDRVRATVDLYADCLVTGSTRKALAYREMKYDDPKSGDTLIRIATTDCLRLGELRMPVDLLRGSVFESFFRRDYVDSPLKLAEKGVDFSQFVNDPKATSSARYLLLMGFADCVVRTDATNTKAYVLAFPGSSEEKQALGALQPVLGPCFPAGGQVTFNKSVMSAILAEALFREVEAGHSNMPEAPR
jgi:hypothetical protein